MYIAAAFLYVCACVTGGGWEFSVTSIVADYH